MPAKNPRLAVILPVHNEEKTIKGVIDAFLSFDLFDEIIAVTDGTTDRSLKILEDYAKKKKTVWLNYEANRGKGFALAKGVEKATADIVVFFDTDQTNTRREHLERMTRPLINGEADYVIGNHGKENKLNPFRNVCGNRSYFRKDLLPLLKAMQTKRRSVELFLNYELSKKGKKAVFVSLAGLTHYWKISKRNTQEGLRDYLREGYELAAEYAHQKKLSGVRGKEFVRSKINEFLRDYAHYVKLPARKTKTLVNDFLDNLWNRR